MSIEILEQYRHDRAVHSINIVLDAHRVSQAELAEAMGVYSAPGKQSAVGRWLKGYEKPSAKNQAMLDLLANGQLTLHQVGKRGRRRLYDVVTPDELAA